MMPVSKGTPPRELSDAIRRIKGTPGVRLSWSSVDHQEREAVLNSLLNEQGSLCAYCMRRIDADKAHVEHIKPQSEGKGKNDPDSVNYQNMLAVCDGFEGNKAGLTCDRARGNKPLVVNPLRPDTIASIRYQHDGVIKSDNEAVSIDIDKTLNLNQQLLVRNRKAAIVAMEQKLDSMAKKRGNDSMRSYCKKYIDEHLSDVSERLSYDGAVIYFMRRRAHAAS